jgi:uncharacterized protein YdaT
LNKPINNKFDSSKEEYAASLRNEAKPQQRSAKPSHSPVPSSTNTRADQKKHNKRAIGQGQQIQSETRQYV